MASPPNESPGGWARLDPLDSIESTGEQQIFVRQVQTNEEYTVVLEVDPNLVDEDGTTRNVIFRLAYLAMSSLESLGVLNIIIYIELLEASISLARPDPSN